LLPPWNDYDFAFLESQGDEERIWLCVAKLQRSTSAPALAAMLPLSGRSGAIL